MPMLADYLRGWTGLGLSGLPLVTMQPSWPIGLALLALRGLFAGFLRQTWRRQHSRLRLAASGVALIGSDGRQVAWRELDGVRLRWFGTRRQGRGWLELELRGCGPRLVVTSALDRFDQVVAEAVQAATIAACASSPRPGPTSRRCWAAPPDADQPPQSSWR